MALLHMSLVSANVAFLLALTTGCTHLKTTLPSMELLAVSAKSAAAEPATWVPLTAAVVIGLSGADNNISDWASDETPVFGSQRSAGDFSDYMRNSLVAGAVLSSIFAPDSDEHDGFPTRRVLTNALAFGAVASIVETGKRTVKRERPNERDDRSFPSGHSATSFTSARLIEQNLNETLKKPWLRKTIKAGTYSSAAAVAWARVEANEHHPVDVLFSAALSNFVVKSVYKSINSEGLSAAQPVAIEAGRKGFAIKLNFTF